MEQADGRISYWILVLCALVIRLVYYEGFRDIAAAFGQQADLFYGGEMESTRKKLLKERDRRLG